MHYKGKNSLAFFPDRPVIFSSKHILFDSDIAVGRDTQRSFMLRKMLHKGFKMFGEGVARFEHQVNDELDRLVVELNTHSRKDVDICPLLKKSFSNWMSSLITGGKAMTPDAEIIWDFNKYLSSLGSGGTLLLTSLLPSLRFLPGKNTGHYIEIA